MFSLLARAGASVTHHVTQLVLCSGAQMAVFCAVVIQLVTVAVDCEAIFEYFWPGMCSLVTLALIWCIYKYIYFKVCGYIKLLSHN